MYSTEEIVEMLESGDWKREYFGDLAEFADTDDCLVYGTYSVYQRCEDLVIEFCADWQHVRGDIKTFEADPLGVGEYKIYYAPTGRILYKLSKCGDYWTPRGYHGRDRDLEETINGLPDIFSAATYADIFGTE